MPPQYQPQHLINYVSGFTFSPQRLSLGRSSFTWVFNVSAQNLGVRPRLVANREKNEVIVILEDGNVSHRLRCIKFKGCPDIDSFSTWSRAESSWPEVVYIHVNNSEIHRQRTRENVPIVINSWLRQGSNHIRVNVLYSKQQRMKDTSYAVAIETVMVKSSASFRSLVKTLPAQESCQQIVTRLSSSKKNEDDDLMIMDDFISIDLRDPFTAHIFDVPARSSECDHRECFDLDTFLRTLLSNKSEKPAIYIRCPICKKDARPELLIVDEFLSQVRSTLAKQNQLDTAKAIRVKSDGSWSAVLDTDNENRGTSRKRDRTSFESDFIKDERDLDDSSRTTSAPEVIEID